MDTPPLFCRLRWPSGALILVLLLASGHAAAQWQWKDPSGRRVFSDTPPPASVAERDILQRPGQRPGAVATPADAVPGNSASAAPAPTQPALGGNPLDEKKKQLEKAEADKQLAERKAIEAKNAKTRADNCESARRAKAALDAGVRLSTTNAQGEVEYLDEAGRAAQGRKLQELIRDNCR